MKSKTAATLFASLLMPHKFTGPLSESKRIISVAELRDGSNTGTVFVGGVSAITPTISSAKALLHVHKALRKLTR